MNTLVLVSACFALVAAAPEIQLTESANPSLEDLLEKEFKLRTLALLTERNNEQGLTNAQRDEMLEAHNKARRNVNPPAANMAKMKWDKGLEATAQGYANKCKWKHNGDRSKNHKYYVGENLYLTTAPTFIPSDVVNSWDKEKNSYNYDTLYCGSVCGHYTQVVWASSTHVGCGVKRCSSVEGLGGWKNLLIVVCNYGPGGNYRGQAPYVKGSSCSACKSGMNVCDNNLCSETKSSKTSSDKSCQCK